jgi:hypothetical protein
MRSTSEVEQVNALIAQGLNDCQIARTTGIPRSTVRMWRTTPRKERTPLSASSSGCPFCGDGILNRRIYAYLLGVYLGDGCISCDRKGVFRLRISLDLKYPDIIDESAAAMSTVGQRPAGKIARPGCVELYSNWKHWPCLFPQHGPGPKHRREIKLVDWQLQCTRAHPDQFLKGLIHSDGCRLTNRVRNRKGKEYAYPRYMFTNFSSDIRKIFCDACVDFGVSCRRMNWKTISVARRADVAKLDSVIGPKR